MRVIVTITRDDDTRNAVSLNLLYGPYNTEVPDVNENWTVKYSKERAEQDIVECGLDGFKITSVVTLAHQLGMAGVSGV